MPSRPKTQTKDEFRQNRTRFITLKSQSIPVHIVYSDTEFIALIESIIDV